ncbi:phosphonoacetaldehyde reductase [Allorhodopirellula heiligendammensis]|uniref:Phosphonoacetaldehyde reductase n=1 Tax=Allorhodopirellula heiligendammensis TaxID=2714739 RepID=A0A5C6BEC0_9BACT|nr:phosphonoacetaldehyde reductase [Allorhodopirellula heiligendammensis]TWU10473.1 Phosphonoacetaldehyde reductase [Allorhodopirellula heiligendammensis]
MWIKNHFLLIVNHYPKPAMPENLCGEPTVNLAENAIHSIGVLVRDFGAERVLLVVDEDAAHASGANRILTTALATCQATRFNDFELNPQFHDIERGIRQFQKTRPQIVIALGGGTAIDLGKLIGSIAVQPATAMDIVTGRVGITKCGPPLVAIPTTAGTGSEATQFAVAYVDQQKYSVSHKFLLPSHAIVDPSLTASLPPRITAATGLDAFCQAIESIWAVGATDESVGYAAAAVELAREHLVDAVVQPSPVSRMGMCQASHLSGKAINISKTTASHALSYGFTSQHKIPHGMAVAMTISRMLAHNAGVSDEDCMDPRGADHVRKRIELIMNLLGTAGVHEACVQLDTMITAIGCACSPARAGVGDAATLRKIVTSVNAERMSNNPRSADATTLMELLQSSPRTESFR